MAETDKTTMPDGVEQPAPEAQSDNLTAPAPPDITDISGDVVDIREKLKPVERRLKVLDEQLYWRL